MKNILQTAIQTIQSKFTMVRNKLRTLFSLSTLKSRFTNFIRKTLPAIFNLKPRNQKDYVHFFSWMVSRRLVTALVTLIALFSLYYLCFVNPPSVFSGGDGIRTYAYDSVPLRFAKGKVRIKAASGYIAYEGEVEKGFTAGEGTLYSQNGLTIYKGEFDKNKYNGTGTLYYDGSQIQYEGEFRDNQYEGEGVLFRENGSREYEGSFSQGMKEGEGTLYDTGNNPVFTGAFSRDELLYSNLLAKTTAEIGEVYTGDRKIFTDGDSNFTVALEDINAIYVGAQDGIALDDSMKVDGLYVLKDSIRVKDKVCTDITELNRALGNPIYEGNSEVTFPEAVAISYLNKGENSLFGPVNMDLENQFSDVAVVRGYDPDYLVYLYSYQQEDILYTFYCKEKNGKFAMYSIEKE